MRASALTPAGVPSAVVAPRTTRRTLRRLRPLPQGRTVGTNRTRPRRADMYIGIGTVALVVIIIIILIILL